MKTELTLSLVATTLATASLCGQAWRIWRDRPRLIFFVKPITFTNVPRVGEMKMLQVMICNIGYRPIVLTKFAAVGNSSSFQMGIDDEPAALLGRQDQRFPTLLEPGKTLKIHPIGIEALKRNQTDPKDPLVHYDPYRHFLVIDSFGRLYPIDIEDVLSSVGLLKEPRPKRGWAKAVDQVQKQAFLRRARKWI
jgi:hypothetical protein